jgi:ABC-type sugar transport system permease subunit
VIAVPVVGIVFSYILQRNGLLNELLRSLGATTLAHDWLGDSGTAIWAILCAIIWQQLGFGVVLFLARLSSLEGNVLEAALLDRAGWWQRFRNILVPHLATTIEFFVTLSLINMLSWVFNYVFVMTNGGPAQSTNVLELLLYNYAFLNGLPNLASALSVLVLVLALILLAGLAVVRRRVERLEG